MSKRESIIEKGDNIFKTENNQERQRLLLQQNLLYDFDMQIYSKYFEKNKPLNILDLGCNDGNTSLRRFANYSIKQYVGLDIIEQKQTGKKNISLYQVDLEDDNLDQFIEKIMRDKNIDGFDVINALALFAHIKNPSVMLSKIKKFCKKDALIFVRNIDDGFNICYGSKMVEKGLKFLDKTKFTGFRYSGRQIPKILYSAGITNVKLEKTGISTLELDKIERNALFHTIFDFIKNSLDKENSLKIISVQNERRKEWLDHNFEKLEKDFMGDDFFLHFGFMFYVGRL